jgi:drug/metabolite transporter (DMT)-like permease
VFAIAGLALSNLQPRTLTSSLSLALVMTRIFCAASTLSIYFAVKHISPSEVSQYHYTQLLARAFIVYLVWYDKPVLPLLAGGSLISCSGLLIALAARNTQLPFA